MKKGLLQILRFTAFLTLGIILVWLAFRKTDFSKVADRLLSADYSWVLLSVVFSFLAYVSRARRWNLLINPLGYRPSLSASYHSLMTGYLANMALPRIGEVTRCVALGKKEKIPVDQLIGTVLIERTVDFISLMLITIVVFFTSSDQVVELMNESIFIPLQKKLISIFGSTWLIWAALLFMATGVLYILYRNRKRLRRIKFLSKLFDMAKGIINGLKSIINLQKKWEFIFHTIFIWFCYTMMTWVVVFSLEATSNISIGEGIFLLVVGGIAMSAPVQGGFGVFHYAISRAIVTLEGVPMEDGLAYAVLTHESQMLWIIFAGIITFILFFKKTEKIHPLHPLDDATPSTELT